MVYRNCRTAVRQQLEGLFFFDFATAVAKLSMLMQIFCFFRHQHKNSCDCVTIVLQFIMRQKLDDFVPILSAIEKA